jgi:hypothetical protein
MTTRPCGVALLLAVFVPLGASAALAQAPLETASPVFVHVDAGERGSGGGGGHRHQHPAGDDDLARGRAASGALLGPSGPGAGPAQAIATSGVSFDAINDSESTCNCLPPDGAIAVGPNHVLGAVNTAYAVWDKQGNVLVAATGFAALFSAATLPDFTDPFADYDPVAGRFMVGLLNYDTRSGTSAVVIAVSESSDPTTGNWITYSFSVGSGLLLDFPHAAIGSDAIYLGGNVFARGKTFSGARVYAYDKNAMYAGKTASFTFQSGQPNADTLSPAHGAEPASAMYFLSAANAGCPCNGVTVYKWLAPFGANQFTVTGSVSFAAAYGEPPTAVQPPGGYSANVDTNDAGILETFWHDGTLYAAHAVGAGGVPTVHWFQLGGIDGPAALLQEGTLNGSGDRYFPSIAVDSAGNVGLVYSYSSSTDFVGIRMTGRLANDQPGTMTQPETVLQAGLLNTDGSRWGDYGMAVLDPSDGVTIWNLLEYANDFWDTRINSFRFAAPAPDFALSVAAPTSQQVAAGSAATYTVNVTPSNGYTGAVALGASGLPSGATASFNPTPVAGGSGASMLMLTTSGSTPGGTYTITISGTDGTLTHTTSATLVVVVPDFTVSVAPTAATVGVGAPASYTVTVAAQNGFAGTVSLSLAAPPGPGGSFTPAAVVLSSGTPSGTSTLSVSSATAGTFTLTITGTSGSLTHSQVVTLTVQPNDFTLRASPTSRSASARKSQSASYAITVTPTGGFNQSVAFSASGVPSGATVTLPSPSPTGTTLTVRVSPSTPRGTYTITVTGVSGTLSHTVNVVLTVTK